MFPTNKNGDIKYKEKDSPKPDERLLNTLQYCTFLVSKKICEEVGMEHLFDKNHPLNDKQKEIVENVLNKYIYGMTNTSIVEIFCKDKQSLRSKSFTDDGRFKQTTDPADQMNNIFWLSCGYSEYATIMLEIDEIFEMKDAKETDKKKIRTTFVKDVLIAYEMQDRTVDSEKHRSTINSKNFIGALEATIGTQSDEFIAFLKDSIAFLKETKNLNSTANSEYHRKRSQQPKLYMLPIILSKFCFGIEKLDILSEMLECLIQKDKNENKRLMSLDKITKYKALKNLDKFLSVLIFEKIKGIFLKEAAPLNHQFIIPKIKKMVESRKTLSLKLLFNSFYQDQEDKRRKSVSTTDFLKVFKNVASYDANIADGSKLNVFDKKNIQSAYTILQLLLKLYNVRWNNIHKLELSNGFSFPKEAKFEMKAKDPNGKVYLLDEINNFQMDHAFAEDTINKGNYGIKNVHTRSAINGVSIPGPINESAQNDPLFAKAKEDYNNECCCTELFEYLANQCKEKDEYYFEKHSDEILDLQCRYLEASIQKLSEHLKFAYDPKIIEENSGENS